MLDENDFIDLAKREYRNAASIPVISSASVLGVDALTKDALVSVMFKQQDLDRKVNTRYAILYSLSYKDNDLHLKKLSSGFPFEAPDSILECISPSFKYKAVFRSLKGKKSDSKDEEKTVCELWSKDDCKLIKCVDLSVLDVHGQVHNDCVFGGFHCWSPDEKKLLYVAEKKKEKSMGYFDKSKPKDTTEASSSESKRGDQYVYEESWGEQQDKICNPVICVLDIESEVVTILKNIPDYLSPAQPQWGPDSSIVFVGLWNVPYRLGRIYCENRKSAVFMTEVDTEALPMQLSQDGNMAVHSPRVSPSKSKVMFLQRNLSGSGDPHRASERIVLYDFVSKETSQGPDAFPFRDNNVSIYSHMPQIDCWLDDDIHVVLPTIYQGEAMVAVLDTSAFAIKVLEPCESVLGTFRNCILMSRSRLDTTSFEFSVLKVWNNDGVLQHSKSCGSTMEFDSSLHSGSLDDIPGVPKCHYVIPETSALLGTGSKAPLIVWPHGGPHSVFPNMFFAYIQGLCHVGFACLLINYRGSTGFDDASLMSLPGHIGTNDVQECQKAAEYFLEKFKDKVDSNLVLVQGGSHGGFLTAQLIGQYPDFYKAAALRNPVINIAAMTSISDIPDWSYFESGLPFSHATIPTAEDFAKMLNVSPVIHIPNIKAPVLLMLGEKDLRVPWSQGKNYYNLLRANGKTAKLLLYPNDQHPLSSVETSADVFMNICLWFYTHLKPLLQQQSGV